MCLWVFEGGSRGDGIKSRGWDFLRGAKPPGGTRPQGVPSFIVQIPAPKRGVHRVTAASPLAVYQPGLGSMVHVPWYVYHRVSIGCPSGVQRVSIGCPSGVQWESSKLQRVQQSSTGPAGPNTDQKVQQTLSQNGQTRCGDSPARADYTILDYF